MPEVKELRRRGLITNRVCGILLVASFGVFSLRWLFGETSALGRDASYAGIGLFVLIPLVMVVGGRPLLCPGCRSFLRTREKDPRARQSHIYYCKRCDVIWDTCISRGDD